MSHFTLSRLLSNQNFRANIDKAIVLDRKNTEIIITSIIFLKKLF